MKRNRITEYFPEEVGMYRISLRAGCSIPKRLLDASATVFNLCQKNALHTLEYLESSAISAQVASLSKDAIKNERDLRTSLLEERQKESDSIEVRVQSRAEELTSERLSALKFSHQQELRSQQNALSDAVFSKEAELADVSRRLAALQEELTFFMQKKRDSDQVEAELRSKIESECSLRFSRETALIQLQLDHERQDRIQERRARETSDALKLESLKAKEEAHADEVRAITEKRLVEKHNSSKKGAATEVEVLELLVAAFPQFEVELCSRSSFCADIKMKSDFLNVLVDVKAHERTESSTDLKIRGIETSEVEKFKRDMVLDPQQDVGILIATKTYFCKMRQQALVDVQILDDGRPVFFIQRLSEREDPLTWIANTLNVPFQQIALTKKLSNKAATQVDALALEMLDRKSFKAALVQNAEDALAAQHRDNKADALRRKMLIKDLEKILEDRRNLVC